MWIFVARAKHPASSVKREVTGRIGTRRAPRAEFFGMSQLIIAAALLTVAVAGCSRRPARLKAPKIDPESAAARALEMYDRDQDGNLSKSELEACAGMKASIAAYDTDHNGAVTEEEIVKRLEYLTHFKTALTPLRARVKFNGQPLNGAQVRLIPEAYLGEHVKPATGITTGAGSASMSISKEDLPKAQQDYHGVHYGTYKIEITHPEKKIPAKYNTETVLGYETEVGNPIATFKLKG